MFGRLFSFARKSEYYDGAHRCFYCGTPCSDYFAARQYVKQSFTSRDTVCGGDYVCGGCVCALDEKATVTLPDGEQRDGQKTRCYSWVFSEAGATAATKAHREWLLQQCLSPPEPPYGICISDSGQRQLLYRSQVCHSRETITVTLEGDPVTYIPQQLIERLGMTKQIAAATGKPALAEGLTTRQQMLVIEYHGPIGESVLIDWLRCEHEPLSRLAAWFTPAKKECEFEYPKCEPAIAGRADDRGV